MDSSLWITSKAGLLPAGEAAAEWLTDQPPGRTVLVSIRNVRHPGFHRKYFVLVDRAFNYWSAHTQPIKYKGVSVQPNKDKFREDVTIAAGFVEAHYGLDGTVRLQAQSIAWSNMDARNFALLYDATIDVLLHQIFTPERYPNMAPTLLEAIRNDIVSFA